MLFVSKCSNNHHHSSKMHLINKTIIFFSFRREKWKKTEQPGWAVKWSSAGDVLHTTASQQEQLSFLCALLLADTSRVRHEIRSRLLTDWWRMMANYCRLLPPTPPVKSNQNPEIFCDRNNSPIHTYAAPMGLSCEALWGSVFSPRTLWHVDPGIKRSAM